MTKFGKISLLLLRLAMGWLFLYAGLTKILNPEWSAAGYLKGAKTFAGFFNWFLSPGVLPVTNFLNEWGLTLIGISLILGIFVRLSSFFGALLMLLYYFPILNFPYAGEHSYIVDEHLIYFFIFALFMAFRAGRAYGLDVWCSSLPICSKFPKLRALLG